MSKAERYIELVSDENGHLCNQHALRAVEIAREDNELTWEDIRKLYIIFAEVDTEIELCKTDITAETLGYFQEVLKRFKELKGK